MYDYLYNLNNVYVGKNNLSGDPTVRNAMWPKSKMTTGVGHVKCIFSNKLY